MPTNANHPTSKYEPNHTGTNTIHFIWLGSSITERSREKAVITQWADPPFYQNHYTINLWYDPVCLDDQQKQQMADFANKHNISLCDVNTLSDKAKTLKHDAQNNIEILMKAHYDIRDKSVHKLWATSSDFLRLIVLYIYGGIYLDTDIWPAQISDDTLKDHEHLRKFTKIANYIPENKRTTFPKDGFVVTNDEGVLLCYFSQIVHHAHLKPVEQYDSSDLRIFNDFIVANKKSALINACMHRLCDKISEEHNILNAFTSSLAHMSDSNFKNTAILFGPSYVEEVAKERLNTKNQELFSEYFLDQSHARSVIMRYNALSWQNRENNKVIEEVPTKQYNDLEAFRTEFQAMVDQVDVSQIKRLKTIYRDVAEQNKELFMLQLSADHFDIQSELINKVFRNICSRIYHALANEPITTEVQWLASKVPGVYDSDTLDDTIDYYHLLLLDYCAKQIPTDSNDKHLQLIHLIKKEYRFNILPNQMYRQLCQAVHDSVKNCGDLSAEIRWLGRMIPKIYDSETMEGILNFKQLFWLDINANRIERSWAPNGFTAQTINHSNAYTFFNSDATQLNGSQALIANHYQLFEVFDVLQKMMQVHQDSPQVRYQLLSEYEPRLIDLCKSRVTNFCEDKQEKSELVNHLLSYDFLRYHHNNKARTNRNAAGRGISSSVNDMSNAVSSVFETDCYQQKASELYLQIQSLKPQPASKPNCCIDIKAQYETR